MKIPITKPSFTDAEEQNVIEVLRSGWVTQGPKVQAFEEAFAQFVGSRYGVAVSSCTTALHLALIAAGVEAGDEVLCPSFSFIATANVIRYCGAEPVFVDIDPRTYNLDPACVEAAVSRRTKAIIAVHQVGLPAEMDEINRIASERGIRVIEDAACAIGSEYKGARIGKPHGFAACFSFHPRKIITAGEGGMITTNEAKVADRLKKLRHHGMTVSDLARHSATSVMIEEYDELGYNYRMSDLHAAIGLAQLLKLGDILARRIRIGRRYSDVFGEVDYLRSPFIPDGCTHTYQSYILRLLPEAPISRDELMRELLRKGIATRRGIMAAHKEPLYAADYGHLNLPETEKAARDTMILPLFPQMEDREQDYVISSILQLVKQPA